ncbi:DinB family protein [Deinococcus sp. KNUC1210]|uniref:DinB family protein n=1 Tax=Deinococcus sp. KNUC1210 TaxID=2917691 RepID=UPI001EF0BFB6|nr:DinB family protein [Deinococcus sp. KNUC1210]ULH15744.1 DinB family protein [Deinococcus sp. KNUC1210]
MSKTSKVWVPMVIAVGAAAAGAYAARGRGPEIREFFIRQTLERPVLNSSYAELAQRLERGGVELTARFERAGESAGNRKALRHIIGIERWGTARIERMNAGGPAAELDGHRSYKPPRDASWAELLADLQTTRAHTVDLARRLDTSPPAEGVTVPHNDLGDLTPKGWLRYLALHANIESRRVRSSGESGNLQLS